MGVPLSKAEACCGFRAHTEEAPTIAVDAAPHAPQPPPPAPAPEEEEETRSREAAEQAMKAALDFDASPPSPAKKAAAAAEEGQAIPAALAVVASPLRTRQQGVTELPPAGGACPLLSCPWGDWLAHFLTLQELEWLCCTSSALRTELTMEEECDGVAKRKLLAPLIELKIETAEAQLERVSLAHVRTLRIGKRLSFDAVVASITRAGGPKVLRSLERIAFKGCPLYPDDITSTVHPIFSSVSGIKHLNLERNNVTDDTVLCLVNSGALDAARLESINFRFNRVGPKGAKALASCESFSGLKWINLKMNMIGDEGACAIAERLTGSGCEMTLLNLRRQSPALTEKTAIAFAEVLRSNGTLEQLRLRKNHLGDSGAVALGHAVSEHLRLMSGNAGPAGFRFELDLEENQIKAKGALSLIRGLVDAPERGRIELLVHGNRVDRAGVIEAAAALSGRPLDAGDPRLMFDTKAEGIL